MTAKIITYRGKTQSVRDWAIELAIPIKTIYGRLKCGWPSELVLSKKYFHFKTELKIAQSLQQREGYPIKTYRSSMNYCCVSESICQHAIPLTSWEEVSNDPSEGNYYCRMLAKFMDGKHPKCVDI